MNEHTPEGSGTCQAVQRATAALPTLTARLPWQPGLAQRGPRKGVARTNRQSATHPCVAKTRVLQAVPAVTMPN